MRSRRVENTTNQTDSKKQFQLDLEKIANGEDSRTTLMIKNIPNKYTSKMLLAAIDEFHKGTYDFLYLPIDFKNKCKVGYAFINMLSPSHIIPFYEAFNGMKWEKFNSEKVASLAYARIQGRVALVAHFQNSSLMNGLAEPIETESITRELLHTDNCYIFDCGPGVFVWMGKNTTLDARKSASRTAEELLRTLDRPMSHIIRVTEGSETVAFRSKFDSWPQTVQVAEPEEGRGRVAALLKRQGLDVKGLVKSAPAKEEELEPHIDCTGHLQVPCLGCSTCYSRTQRRKLAQSRSSSGSA